MAQNDPTLTYKPFTWYAPWQTPPEFDDDRFEMIICTRSYGVLPGFFCHKDKVYFKQCENLNYSASGNGPTPPEWSYQLAKDVTYWMLIICPPDSPRPKKPYPNLHVN